MREETQWNGTGKETQRNGTGKETQRNGKERSLSTLPVFTELASRSTNPTGELFDAYWSLILI